MFLNSNNLLKIPHYIFKNYKYFSSKGTGFILGNGFAIGSNYFYFENSDFSDETIVLGTAISKTLGSIIGHSTTFLTLHSYDYINNLRSIKQDTKNIFISFGLGVFSGKMVVGIGGNYLGLLTGLSPTTASLSHILAGPIAGLVELNSAHKRGLTKRLEEKIKDKLEDKIG